jgi:hypothetical protein
MVTAAVSGGAGAGGSPAPHPTSPNHALSATIHVLAVFRILSSSVEAE